MLLPPSFSLLFPPIPKKELHHFSPLRYNSPLPFSWVLIQKSTLLFAVFRFVYSAGPGSPPPANVFKLPLTVQTTCQSHLPRPPPTAPKPASLLFLFPLKKVISISCIYTTTPFTVLAFIPHHSTGSKRQQAHPACQVYARTSLQVTV